jgi:hypothetical protein
MVRRNKNTSIGAHTIKDVTTGSRCTPLGTPYEVKVGRSWVTVSDIGYSHYKGKRRIVPTLIKNCTNFENKTL